MKEKNIKLFKQFLSFRGLEKIFAGLYRTHRFQANPEDLQQYLVECDAFFVISEAFDFEHIKVTGPYDSNFWKDLNKMWIKYMRKQAGLGYYRDEVVVPRIPYKDAKEMLSLRRKRMLMKRSSKKRLRLHRISSPMIGLA